VINDPINPTVRRENSVEEKERTLLLIRSSPVAAAIVGIAKRNENSTAFCRDSPVSCPPTIVAAERDTPGMTDRDWMTPIAVACFGDICSKLSIAVFFLLRSNSNAIRAMPQAPERLRQSTDYPTHSVLWFYTEQTLLLPWEETLKDASKNFSVGEDVFGV
jgi:hypothetical protein